MQQWILARPEMREFLPRRIMVDYPEAWMDSVETMKTVQGWTDTSILHFRDMAIFGEKLLLSIRFGRWTDEIHQENAANWARYWRPEVQGYMYAYATKPSILLQQRLPQPVSADAQRRPLASGSQRRPLPSGSQRRALPSGSQQRRRADTTQQQSGQGSESRARP
jgi:hypothetical protein